MSGLHKESFVNPNANGKADALFVQNHDLAVGLLFEGLRQVLEADGFKLRVEEKTSNLYGRPDVVIKPIGTGVLGEIADRKSS